MNFLSFFLLLVENRNTKAGAPAAILDKRLILGLKPMLGIYNTRQMLITEPHPQLGIHNENTEDQVPNDCRVTKISQNCRCRGHGSGRVKTNPLLCFRASAYAKKISLFLFLCFLGFKNRFERMENFCDSR